MRAMHQTSSRQNPGKSSGFWKWSLAISLAILPLLGAYLQPASSSPEPAAATTEPEPQPTAAADQEEPPPSPQEAAPEISDAPAKPVSRERSFPANIHPSEGMSQIVSLAESGVEERVMLAFVTNSASRFSLGSDEIIYLNDIGVSPSVITAMLEHDKVSTETATPAPPPPAQSPSLQITEGAYPPVSSEPMPSAFTEADYPTEYPPETPVLPLPEPPAGAYTSFYDTLAPYGTWVDVQGYGRCWQPTAVITDRGWQPYLDCGRWVYTDCGWYWKSDYSWGWAPFHYGRWFRHQNLGWCWAPDSVWAPSWVCWRYTSDYCGWAPLPPSACFTVGVGLTFHGHPAKPFSDFHIAADCFPFVPLRNLCDHHLRHHVVLQDQAAHIYKHSTAFAAITPHNHTIFNHGIAPERVSAASHVPIQAVAIRDETQTPRHGSRETLEARNSTLNVFRLGSPSATQISSSSTTQTRSRFPAARNPQPTPTTVASATPNTTAAPALSAPSARLTQTATETPAGGGFVIRGNRWGAANSESSTLQTRDATRSELTRNGATTWPANSFNSPMRSQNGPTPPGRNGSILRDTSRNNRGPFGASPLAKNGADKNRDEAPTAAKPDLETSPVQPVFGVRHQNSPFSSQHNTATHRQPPDNPQQTSDPGASIPSRSAGQSHSSFESHRSWASGLSERAHSAPAAEAHQSHSAPPPAASESRSAPAAESHQTHSSSAPASSSSSSSGHSGGSSSSSSSSSSGKGR